MHNKLTSLEIIHSLKFLHSGGRSLILKFNHRIPLQLFLSSVLILTSIGFSDKAFAQDPPEVVNKLKKGERYILKGKIGDGVRELRKLLEDHRESQSAEKGLKLLASRGYGPHTQVLFKTESTLKKLGFSEEALVLELEKKLKAIWVFYAQTYSNELSHEFQIVVHDNRSKFIKENRSTKRRSFMRPVSRGTTKLPRHRIDVYYDARLRSTEDALEILTESAVREMTRIGLRLNSKNRLPAFIELGLSEYIALRLFPRQLSSVRLTPEALVRGKARKGRLLISKYADFERILLQEDPVKKVSPRGYWRWAALSYAFTDFLLNGSQDSMNSKANTLPQAFNGNPRNLELQNFLREFQLRTTLNFHKKSKIERIRFFDDLFKRHFSRPLKRLHQDFLKYLNEYPLQDDDFDLLPEI